MYVQYAQYAQYAKQQQYPSIQANILISIYRIACCVYFCLYMFVCTRRPSVWHGEFNKLQSVCAVYTVRTQVGAFFEYYMILLLYCTYMYKDCMYLDELYCLLARVVCLCIHVALLFFLVVIFVVGVERHHHRRVQSALA